MKRIDTSYSSTSVRHLRRFTAVLLAIFFLQSPSSAQERTSLSEPVGLLEHVLAPGAPAASVRATSSSTKGDEQWISQWSTPGIDLYGIDMVMADAGLVIGGQFARAGDTQVRSLAIWDPGSGTWDDMSGGVLSTSGFLGTVWAVESVGDLIYVGGDFDTAGGVPASNIAVYNTTTQTWSALGDGVDSSVRDIAVNGSTVYVGGNFTNAGGAPAAYIASWNGATWSPLGAGMDNSVYSLTIFNSELYAGGRFTTAGAVTATRVARWNGVAWNNLSDGVGEGFNSDVNAFASSGNMLYFGGNFTEAAGTPGFNYVASWNSTTSTYGALGTGFTNAVVDLAHDGSALFATGVFEQAGINDVNFIAEWNGTTWNSVGGGLWTTEISGVAGQALVANGSDVYASGFFAGAGNTPAIGVARWDSGSSTWNALGSGPNTAPVGTAQLAIVWAGAEVEDGIYFGGQGVDYAGGEYLSGIGFWDETTKSWSSVGGVTLAGNPGNVLSILPIGDNIYVGGEFENAGGVAANNIAVYNSATSVWTSLGAGTDGRVNALYNIGGSIYAGGDFTMAGGIAANSVAVWNGASWSALGTGVDNEVYAIDQYNNEIYVGGRFSDAGGNPASNIARWNGVSWSTLDDGVGEGVDDDVRTIEVVGDSVMYIGGFFEDAGGVAGVNHVVAWRNASSTFSTLGPGFDEPVYALHMGPDDQLYAAGVMQNSGLTPVNNVALWNGAAWEGLGSGTDYQEVGGGVVSITTSENGNDLYFGGVFAFTGGKVNQNIARYNLAPTTAVDDVSNPTPSTALVVDNYPNPFGVSTSIEVTLDDTEFVTINVYDILGRQVSTVVDGATLPAGKSTFQFDGASLRSGVYFYRVEAGAQVASGLMTFVR